MSGVMSSLAELKNLDLSFLGGPALAEVGKIKIGGKGKEMVSREGKRFRVPERYDHFVITKNFKDPATDQFIADTELMEEIAKKTNQDPKNLKFIPIVLLFDDPALNFQIRCSCYCKGRLWCIGDGTKAFRLNQGERKEVRCPCERLLPTYVGSEKCKVFVRLSVLIAGIDRIGGVWVFRTTSWNSCRNILSSMMLIRQLTGGILAGIPLRLVISPKTVVIPTTGQTQIVYVVGLEFAGSLSALSQRALDIRRQRLEYKIQVEVLEDQIRKKLAALPLLEEDEKDIQEEFYPENEASEANEDSENKVETESESQTEETEEANPPENEAKTEDQPKAESKEAVKTGETEANPKEQVVLW